MADYRDIDPLFGTLADADAMLESAHDLGYKVIVDLVPNHSSDELVDAGLPRRQAPAARARATCSATGEGRAAARR